MKVDIDCTIRDGKAEISISIFERVSRPEFEEYADMLRREGFEYDSYTKSNVFTTENPSMLAAMLKFLDKEFEVSARLNGKERYSWDERDQFVQDFKKSLHEEKEEEKEPVREIEEAPSEEKVEEAPSEEKTKSKNVKQSQKPKKEKKSEKKSQSKNTS